MAGPLEGIRVLDLTRILSGPFSTMVMADLGADVIKVEEPVSGDPARGNGPFLPGSNGEENAYSTYFMSINRGKRSVTLDLSKDRGREIFLEMVKTADVVLENYKPGTAKRLGISERTLRYRLAKAREQGEEIIRPSSRAMMA